MGRFKNIGRAQGTLVGLKLTLVGLGPYQAYNKRRPWLYAYVKEVMVSN